MSEFVISVPPAIQKTQDTLPQLLLYAAISASSSGDNTLVAADPAKKIKVQSYVLVAGGTVNVTFKSGSTAISGAIPLVANSGAVCPPVKPSHGSYFQNINVNENLILNLSGSVQVSGHLSYYLE